MKKLIIFLITVMGFFSACSLEEPSKTETPSDPGDLVTGNYVAIGNSLTAGFQSGSLVETNQAYSFPKLIAEQMGVQTFEQPTISYPGLPPILELQSFDGTIVEASGMGTPTNLSYGAPYNNLGIPGIVLADVLLSSSTQSSKDQGLSGSELIDVILRGQGTVFQQAKALQPSFITLWIGNNDVLGFATSGGVKPAAPTPSATFSFLYSQLADSIASLGANVAVANIPNVTDIPFFTTVGPRMAPGIAAAMAANNLIAGLVYQKHGEIAPATGVTTLDASSPELVTLTGGPYASLLGQPTGKWYRDLAADQGIPVSTLLTAMPLIDTTQAFGFHPQNPWPDALILDEDEINTATSSISDFNSTISTIATAKNWALVDINAFLNAITTAGGVYQEQGIVITTKYIEGEMFSLDGVHPSTVGYGVVANQFITAMNNKFGTAITHVDLYKLRATSLSKLANARLTAGALNNTLRILGAR